MGLFEKQNPVGIDKPIQKLSKRLYDGLGYSNIDAYGRAYLMKDNDDKVKPHRYIEDSNGEYTEILFNDTLNGHFFFLDNPETKPFTGVFIETQVDIIFFFNLENLKPDIDHRADEEIRNEIMAVLERERYFETTNIIKDEDALAGFETDLEAIQPRFFLKVTGNIRYQFNC